MSCDASALTSDDAFISLNACEQRFLLFAVGGCFFFFNREHVLSPRHGDECCVAVATGGESGSGETQVKTLDV